VLGDEVVGAGFGLLPGQQLLPGVLRHRRDRVRGGLGARLGVRERGCGREGDLLGGGLALLRLVSLSLMFLSFRPAPWRAARPMSRPDGSFGPAAGRSGVARWIGLEDQL
jgi:hypothetical protein